MESRIKQICGFSDHFWYPEICKHINEVSKSLSPTVDLDLNTLFNRRPNTIRHEITVLVLKILHSLKKCFSREYRTNFERSVEVLIHSERKLRATLILQKAGRRFLFNKHSNDRGAVRKQNIMRDEKQLEKAALIAQSLWKGRQVHKQFIPLRDKIRETEKKFVAERVIINILTQYQASNRTIKSLTEKKPTGFRYLLGPNADDIAIRNNTLEHLRNLDDQIHDNRLISDNFKRRIEGQTDIDKVLNAIDIEMQNHETIIQECRQSIEEAKAGFASLAQRY